MKWDGPTGPVTSWSLSSHRVGDRTVVAVGGELDMRTAPQLRELLTQLATDGRLNLIVDLENVGVIDSTGLGVLCGAMNRVRSKAGTLDLVASRWQVVRVFEETGLDRVFPIHRSLEAALCSSGQNLHED
jgi:anti-sigma B factor antagonist